jgi:glycerate kinase
MKIVIAPDKFKGSLSSLEFCSAVEDGINRISAEVDILKLPLADVATELLRSLTITWVGL